MVDGLQLDDFGSPIKKNSSQIKPYDAMEETGEFSTESPQHKRIKSATNGNGFKRTETPTFTKDMNSKIDDMELAMKQKDKSN